LDRSFFAYDVKRLEMYAQNLVDYHLVIDLVPETARLYFLNKLGAEFNLSLVQAAILVGIGLQRKSIEELEKELQLPPNQLLAMFNKIVKKMISFLEEASVHQMNKVLFANNTNGNGGLDAETLEKMQPLKESLEDELREAAIKVKAQEMEQKKQLINVDLKQYEIKGSEKEWDDALKLPTNSYVSVKRFVLLSFLDLNFDLI
jgi:N-acetyltransferase 10